MVTFHDLSLLLGSSAELVFDFYKFSVVSISIDALAIPKVDSTISCYTSCYIVLHRAIQCYIVIYLVFGNMYLTLEIELEYIYIMNVKIREGDIKIEEIW